MSLCFISSANVCRLTYSLIYLTDVQSNNIVVISCIRVVFFSIVLFRNEPLEYWQAIGNKNFIKVTSCWYQIAMFNTLVSIWNCHLYIFYNSIQDNYFLIKMYSEQVHYSFKKSGIWNARFHQKQNMDFFVDMCVRIRTEMMSTLDENVKYKDRIKALFFFFIKISKHENVSSVKMLSFFLSTSPDGNLPLLHFIFWKHIHNRLRIFYTWS